MREVGSESELLKGLLPWHDPDRVVVTPDAHVERIILACVRGTEAEVQTMTQVGVIKAWRKVLVKQGSTSQGTSQREVG